MSEAPLKRSELLAIENVKRIAEQLRSERNDARAAAQLYQERADTLAALLREAREALRPEVVDLARRVDEALDAHKSI